MGSPPQGLGMPHWGLLLQLGRAYSFAPAHIRLADGSARIDAWEKLITACSCGRQAPMQLTALMPG